MSNQTVSNMCGAVCWIVGTLFGLLMIYATTQSVGWLAAFMLGLALTVFVGIVLTRVFCAGSGAAIGFGPSSGASGASEASGGASPAARTAATATSESAPATSHPAPSAEASAPAAETPPAEAAAEGDGEESRPEALSGPRGGKADNLKEIKGVGPKLEQLLHSMGFYHFDQIAGWTAAEVAWVDANLEGFKGRVTRDNWVEQAKILASGGETEFSKRVDEGDVY